MFKKQSVKGCFLEYAKHFGKIWAAGNISKMLYISKMHKMHNKQRKNLSKSDNVQNKNTITGENAQKT